MKTIKDIAQAADVSITTVSRVFNGYKGIKEETRLKVLAVAQELDYSPNRSAVQLVSGREDTIGVLLSSLGAENARDEYLVGLIAGTHSEAEKHQKRVAIFTVDSILSNNQNYVQFCRANNLIGLIIHGLNMDDPHINHLIASAVPCVFIDMRASGAKVACVSIDNTTAASEVINKLAGLGHRNIVYVAGSARAVVNAERLEGYRKGLVHNGLTHEAVVQSDFMPDTTYRRVKEYLLDHPDTTAFFCASDIMAAATLNACMDLGYDVPGDISIVGFDNLTLSQLTRPPLSTVDQNFFAMGAAATKLLLGLQDGEPTPGYHFIRHKVLIRGSAAKCKK